MSLQSRVPFLGSWEELYQEVLRTGRLTALLIEAAKSQEAKIRQMSAQIEQLKLNCVGQ